MLTSNISHTIESGYVHHRSTPSVLTRFFTWSKNQQESRLLWLGIALVAHGCIFTPLTVMVVMFTGNNLFFFVAAITAMGMTLVTNLAALPTKITIPLFILSLLIDLGIIISCVVIAA